MNTHPDENPKRSRKKQRSQAGLEYEIELLRRLIDRGAEELNNSSDARVVAALLTSIGSACGRLATVLKTQQDLNGKPGANQELYDMLDQAIVELQAKYRKPAGPSDPDNLEL